MASAFPMNSDDIFTQRARRWFIIVVEETFGFGSFHDLHYMTSWAEWQEVFLQFVHVHVLAFYRHVPRTCLRHRHILYMYK